MSRLTLPPPSLSTLTFSLFITCQALRPPQPLGMGVSSWLGEDGVTESGKATFWSFEGQRQVPGLYLGRCLDQCQGRSWGCEKDTQS